MEKQYNFDNSCEFAGTTKEGVIAGINKWNSECVSVNIGDYTCRIHPCRMYRYEERTGRSYDKMLSAVINEFSEGGSEYDALCNIYELYGDSFDNGEDEELLSGFIDFTMCTIEDSYSDGKVKKGELPKSFRDILEKSR